MPRDEGLAMTAGHGAAAERRFDALEPLLAECLELYSTEGRSAVEELLQRHPDLAARVRERLDELARIGLLGIEREAHPPGAFGRYRILRRLGQGGMGTVYLALDERLGRRVALKAAHVPLEASDRSRVRFDREVRAFAQLAHPCIVPILDVGEAGGRPYFTMEYVEGATLARIVEELGKRRVPVERLTGDDLRQVALEDEDGAPAPAGAWSASYVETACRLVLDVADALAHAHRSGVVHRDVKPSNVMVRRDGRAQLFDLGLAHLSDQPALTRSGDIAGTPYYLSPEQVAGRTGDVDHRTDVYSLGVTLFELLTLTRPFGGRTTEQVLKQIQTREPPLVRRLNPAVPADLETVCLRAMEKDRARRYPTMEALAADLRRFLAAEPVHARPIGRTRRAARFVLRNPTPSLAAALALVVLVGLPLGLLWANAEIRHKADEASEQARLKSRVTDFLVDLFAQEPGAARPVAELSAGEFLERGALRLETDFESEPLVRAALMEAVGRAYRNLGLSAEALPLLDRALAVRQRELGEAHTEVAAVLQVLSELHLEAGNVDAALALARRSLAAFEDSGAAGSAAATEARITLAEAAMRLGQLRLAEETLRDALRSAEALGGETTLVADVLERLAALARERGELDVAATHLERALAIRKAAWAPDPAALAKDLEALAEVQRARGEEERATGAEEAARALDRRPEAAAQPTGDAELALADLRPAWSDAFRASFQAGITALQSRRAGEAILAFERCRGWKPEDPVCAYNIACAHALSGDRDAGIEWLARAAGLGFANAPGRIEVAEKDADIALLREDPRGAALLERMRAQRAESLAYAAEAGIRLPTASQEGPSDGGSPLLVVLHGAGRTRDDVVSGAWARIAKELGAALLAPSGTLPTGDGPRSGMAWYDDVEDLARRPLACEERILDLVREFCDTHPIDRRAIAIAGEGDAAPLAFDLAVRAPGLFRGALLANGPLLPTVPEERTRTAAQLGLRIEVVLDGAAPPWAGTLAHEELAARTRCWLERRGLATSSRVAVAEDADDELGRAAARLVAQAPGSR